MPKLEDQQRSEEYQAGQRLNAKQKVRLVGWMVVILIVVVLGFTLCISAERLGELLSNFQPILIYTV